MSFTKEDLDHIVNLAHLSVSDEDKAKYLSQLQDVLGYVEQLDQLDLADIAPTAYANTQGTLLREDTILPRQDLLLEQNAPLWEKGCFQVPKILND